MFSLKMQTVLRGVVAPFYGVDNKVSQLQYNTTCFFILVYYVSSAMLDYVCSAY